MVDEMRVAVVVALVQVAGIRAVAMLTVNREE